MFDLVQVEDFSCGDAEWIGVNVSGGWGGENDGTESSISLVCSLALGQLRVWREKGALGSMQRSAPYSRMAQTTSICWKLQLDSSFRKRSPVELTVYSF